MQIKATDRVCSAVRESGWTMMDEIRRGKSERKRGVGWAAQIPVRE